MRAPAPRVLGVAVTPPVYKASGGVSAGIQLMRAVAAHAEVVMAVMADRTEQVVEDGLSIRRQLAVNRLGPFQGMVPSQAATLMWRPSLDRLLGEYRPDIVHLHNPHPPGALMAAAKTCLRHGVPYVVSTHGFVEYHDAAAGYGMAAWKRPMMRSLVRRPLEFVSRNAAAVCMLSPEEEAILLDLGADRARLHVVTNGVSPYFLERVPEATRRPLVARFNLSEHTPSALFVGNHTANKGLDVLLEAMHRVQAPLRAVIAGAIRSRPEHAALLQAHRVQALGDRVVFTDFLSLEELRALYQSVSMFAFPSKADTLPLSILEAMASRLPVVSTRVGGIPFEVSPDTGLLTAPNDAAAFASALDELAADRERRHAMGAAGRDKVERQFRWETAADHALAVYARVLGNPR